MSRCTSTTTHSRIVRAMLCTPSSACASFTAPTTCQIVRFTVGTRHPQIGRASVEQHVERLWRRADADGTIILCLNADNSHLCKLVVTHINIVIEWLFTRRRLSRRVPTAHGCAQLAGTGHGRVDFGQLNPNLTINYRHQSDERTH